MGIELAKNETTENARCRCYLYGEELICHKPGVVGALSDEQEETLCPKGKRTIVPIPAGAEESFQSMRDNLHIASHIYQDMPEKGLDEWRGVVKDVMTAHAHKHMPVPHYEKPVRPYRNVRESKAAMMRDYRASPEGRNDRLLKKQRVVPGPTPEEERSQLNKEARKAGHPRGRPPGSKTGNKGAKKPKEPFESLEQAQAFLDVKKAEIAALDRDDADYKKKLRKLNKEGAPAFNWIERNKKRK